MAGVEGGRGTGVGVHIYDLIYIVAWHSVSGERTPLAAKGVKGGGLAKRYPRAHSQ